MDDLIPRATMVALSALSPAPWNPRTIKDERVENLCRSMEADPEFLHHRPVLAMAATEGQMRQTRDRGSELAEVAARRHRLQALFHAPNIRIFFGATSHAR